METQVSNPTSSPQGDPAVAGNNGTGKADAAPVADKGAEEKMPVPLSDTSVEHADIRKKVHDLRVREEQTAWELSAALHEVYTGSFYIAWGYKTFKEYVEGELEYSLRTAQTLVAIQDWFGKMKPNIQKWVNDLGWSKAKELVGVVTPENAASWKKKVEGKSVREIQALVSGAKAPEPAGAPAAEGGTPPAEGGAPAEAPKVEKPERLAFSLFPAQKANVDRAIEKAKAMANSDKPGHALDLICTDFLATNAGIGSTAELLEKLEKQTGLKLVAFDPDQDKIVYGNALLDSLGAPAEEGSEEGAEGGDSGG